MLDQLIHVSSGEGNLWKSVTGSRIWRYQVKKPESFSIVMIFFGLLCECQKAVHKRVVLPRPAVNSADFYLSLSHSKGNQ